MEKITWTPAFSVGVESLDKQHQQIVDMINLLVSETEEAGNLETVSELLTKLTKYANEHFTSEERLLEEQGYPGLAKQVEAHREYRRKVVRLCQDAMAHKDSVPDELLHFVKEWWVKHVLGLDR